ncbi:MAG TPA: hypothetical protein VGM56_07100, partial [Byssovorax sp.]
SLGQVERINQRARTSPIAAGDKVVVYVPFDKSVPTASDPDREGEVVTVTKQSGEREAKAKQVEGEVVPAATGILNGELR